VLRIVADEVREKGQCGRTYCESAAEAGVGRTTAQDALRRAAKLGLAHVEVRLRPGRKHRANVITMVSKEWRAWIDRRDPAGTRLIQPRTNETSPARHDKVQNSEHHGQQDSKSIFQTRKQRRRIAGL
jgi:hypothetical protein